MLTCATCASVLLLSFLVNMKVNVKHVGLLQTLPIFGDQFTLRTHRMPRWFQPGPCKSQKKSCWKHCVPFKGDTSLKLCARATKFDFLKPLSLGRRYCHVSALHMILDDVLSVIYSTNETSNLCPLLTLGTLLGAYRNESLIRWSHDVDLAFSNEAWSPKIALKLNQMLRRKGYILFHDEIWRVCLISTHPLAGVLYNPHKSVTQGWIGDVPYLDLYNITRQSEDTIIHQTQSQTLRYSDVYPTRNISLLGKPYKTFHQPEVFFKGAGYGDFMQERIEPHRRQS